VFVQKLGGSAEYSELPPDSLSIDNAILQGHLGRPGSEQIDITLPECLQVRSVDWSCSLDVLRELEQQREGAHCVSMSLLTDHSFHASGRFIDTKFKHAVKRLFRTLVSVATGTMVDRVGQQTPWIRSKSENFRSPQLICACVTVRVHGHVESVPRPSKPNKEDAKFVPDHLGIEGERQVLNRVQSLRDLFGGDRMYVSSEDWAVLSAELRKSHFLVEGELDMRLSWKLLSMYVRIARGVAFEPGNRTSLHEFDLSSFVPTSAALGGSIFADRVRKYFRVNC